MGRSLLGKTYLKAFSAWLVLLLGVILYIIAFWLFYDQKDLWRELIIQIANVLIIGVVIGYLTNVSAIFGIFTDELTKVLYGKIFLTKRNDIVSIWENVTKQMFKEKFPSINTDLLNIIKGTYLPIDEVIYCRDYEVECRMEWVDQEREIVKTTEKISLELMSESNKSIRYLLGVWVNMGDLDTNDCYCKLNELKVDNKVYVNNVKSNTSYEKSSKETILHHDIVVDLAGNNQYKIQYERVKQYSLKYDYDISFKARYITHGLNIQMVYPKDLDVCFVSRGTINEFQDKSLVDGVCYKSYKGIILPKQGYIFAFKKKS